MDYADYIAVFNSGDDAALVERFFHEDVVFSGGSRDHHGKAALLEFLTWAHDGVREVMRPQAVVRDGDILFCEIDMDFHASKERTDFPFGHLRAGDQVTVKFFVQYRLRDGKVAELKSMTWPPEKGVSRLPRLGGHASQLAAFRTYVAAFANAEWERMGAFYQPDVVLELPSVPPMRGREAILSFYKPMFERVREELTIHRLLADDEAITIDTTSRFIAVADAPDFVVAPLKKGEWVERRVFVHYELKDGLIQHIRAARPGFAGAPPT